jgi:hypothetical protein
VALLVSVRAMVQMPTGYIYAGKVANAGFWNLPAVFMNSIHHHG